MALQLGLLTLLSLSLAVRADGGHHRPKLLPAETTRIPEKAAFFHEYDSKRTTIKYGGVTVPPMNENDGMAQFYQPSTTLPCHDCFITWLQVGVEYADGRTADASTGMWLHHAVLANANQTDAVCGDMGQRFAASGNERTALDLCGGGRFKAGYYLDAADQVFLVLDLMNMHESHAQDGIVLTITYEYVEASKARDFSRITAYWFDVGGCETSSLPAYADSTFIYTSPTLLGMRPGTITLVGGHLHDGGTNINLMKNGKVSCAASATYETYDNPHGGGTTDHISSIDYCSMVGETTPSDGWLINAYYDTKTHTPMSLMDGTLEPVMGIMLVYVAEAADESKQLKRPRYWTVVLGIGGLAAIVVSIAAWLWFRERRRIMLKRDNDVDRPSYMDSPSEEDASVPLIRA